jgi:hypothetical protein
VAFSSQCHRVGCSPLEVLLPSKLQRAQVDLAALFFCLVLTKTEFSTFPENLASVSLEETSPLPHIQDSRRTRGLSPPSAARRLFPSGGYSTFNLAGPKLRLRPSFFAGTSCIAKERSQYR